VLAQRLNPKPGEPGYLSHLLFVDLEKAYDNISLIKLWKALEETRMSSTLIKTVKELYRRSVSYVY
jgi:hypothetical protein